MTNTSEEKVQIAMPAVQMQGARAGAIFSELASTDVSNFVEKKGQFSYLSWAWAVDQLRRKDPEATFRVIRDADGNPYMKTDCGYFVEVEVTCGGIALSEIHPVLDHRNKPIAQPDAFQINTSIKRCLVKAIALHGLGLYIYAGEDLPFVEEAQITGEQVNRIVALADEFAGLRNATREKVYGVLKIDSSLKMTAARADEILDTLASWVKTAKTEDEKKKSQMESEAEGERQAAQ